MHSDLELIRDFVNSADLEAACDELDDPRGLERWFADHRLIRRGDRASALDAEAARDVREALRELLRANNGFPVARDRASAVLDGVARRTGLAVRFDTGSIRLVPRERGVQGALGAVLAAAAAAMADGSWTRLKACRSDSCRWAFVDNTKNRSRQWCSMSVCGNRAKARTFRKKHG